MKFLPSSDYDKLVPKAKVVIYSPSKSRLMKKARVIASVTATKMVLISPVASDDSPFYALYIHTLKTDWIPASMVISVL